MCARYNLRATPAELQQFFHLFREPEGVRPRYNIAPTQMVATIRRSDSGRELVWMRRGLIPSWSKDLKSGPPMINAKSETVAEKPMFRAALKRRRCLIPASGYYEWQPTGPKTKQACHLHRSGDGLFAMAGLWECWDKGTDPIESCTIITRAANPRLASVHDRMPVILHQQDYDAWLTEGVRDPSELGNLLQPDDSDEFVITPVSSFVNNVRNESSACLMPADA